jgi:hypothetical protein
MQNSSWVFHIILFCFVVLFDRSATKKNTKHDTTFTIIIKIKLQEYTYTQIFSNRVTKKKQLNLKRSEYTWMSKIKKIVNLPKEASFFVEYYISRFNEQPLKNISQFYIWSATTKIKIYDGFVNAVYTHLFLYTSNKFF